MSDAVNHPSHYNQGKIEVIEFIEDKNLGFHLGNAIKYISRAGKKDPAKTIEDLEKAIWYVKRHIETLKPESERKRPNDMNQKPLIGHEAFIKALSEFYEPGSKVKVIKGSWKGHTGEVVDLLPFNGELIADVKIKNQRTLQSIKVSSLEKIVPQQN